MKKFLGFFICLFIILSIIPTQAFAAIKLVYDGKVHIYNERPVSLNVNGKTLNPKVPPIIMKGTTLVPARVVFEQMGAKVFWKQSTQQVTVKSTKNTIVLVINSQFGVVNGKKEKLLMPAKIINENTMIPLRFVSEKLGLKVKWNPDTYEIKISDKNDETEDIQGNDKDSVKTDGDGTSGQDANTNETNSGVINNINFQTSSEKTMVRIESSTVISNYSESVLKEEADKPFRVIVDIPDVSINIPQLTIPVEDGRVLKIRSALRQESPKIVRVVLDLASKQGYSINYSDDKKALIVSVDGSITQEDKTKDSSISASNSDDYEFFNSKLGEDNSIDVKDEGEKICISISKKKGQDLKVQRVTNPESIEVVFDTADFQEENFMIPISSAPITSLKGKMLDKQKGKITVLTSNQVPYQVYDESESLNLYIYKEGYKNIRYENSGAISTIIISNTDNKKQVTVEQDTKKNEAKIMLPEGFVDIEKKSLYIEDGMVKWLEINDKNDIEKEINIKFAVESQVSYSVRTDSKNNVYVYFFARDKIKVPDGDILIAIDAGHGGNDPGAVYKDKNGVSKVNEKDLNLDIASKLNKILTDLGIPTIMTRTKDENIDLHQRTNLANSMKADLFVSIHNNWIDNPAIAGTMTLYFPYDSSDRGLTSKRFAEIVQEELLRTIDTTDRKIISRPNLVVLNSSEMPAVLVEGGFLSNESDRGKLTSEEHKEKMAQAMYTAIIKALGELEK